MQLFEFRGLNLFNGGELQHLKIWKVGNMQLFKVLEYYLEIKNLINKFMKFEVFLRICKVCNYIK